MPKYLIEGNIDFYDELQKSLEPANDHLKPTEGIDKPDEYLCLISQKPLTENYVELECKHKFNYNAIFHDVLNHKKKFNTMEKRTLRLTELRCPYCRNIQKTLLPYIDGYPKVHGINHIDEENVNSLYLKMGFNKGTCCYSDDSQQCDNIFVKIMLTDNKSYCHTHYSQVVYKMIKQKQQKIKDAYMKKKMDALQKKQEEKQKKIDAKNAEKQKKIEENKQLGTCATILKSGVNKGKACGCQVIPNSNGLCNRHYKLQESKI